MKLSTSKIIEIVTTSLINTEKILDDVVATYDECAPEKVVEKMKAAWLKPANWKRDSKAKLNDDSIEEWNDFYPDVAGEMINRNAVELGCVHRIFYNKADPFSDNFRLEILTDKQDQTIVAWSLIVD